jgi:hypothetical protein
MTQALLDVATRAFGGESAIYYIQGLFCGSRVKESRLTSDLAFDTNDGTLIISAETAKTDKTRESELYPNVIVMLEVLKKKCPGSQKGARPKRFRTEVIQVLAGFSTNNTEAIRAADAERKRLGKLGVKLPEFNWGIRFPRNALRRTALSMHYKLYLNEKFTIGWAGNSTNIFEDYYKRLVTKEAAREYWVLVPTWFGDKCKRQVTLPFGHKLDSPMTSKTKGAIEAACSAVGAF